MHYKRFSKLLLVVLALALRAGAANGPTSYFSANPSTFTLNYIQGSGGSQTGASQVVTITNNDGSDHTLTLTSSSNLLDVTTAACTGAGTLVTAGATINCTVVVDTGFGNSDSPGPFAAQSIQMNADAGLDQTFSATVNVNPAMTSAQTSLTVSYVLSSESTAQQTSNITSSGTPETYSATKAGGCPGWLTVGSQNTTWQTPDAVVVSIGSSADGAGVVSSSCTVDLKDASGFEFQALTVNYSTVPNWTSSPSDITLTNYKLQSENVIQATYTPTASVSSTAFNANASSTGNWLTVSPLSGSANTSATGTQLTIGLNLTNVDLLSVAQHTGTITITPTGGGSPLVINVKLTVTAANSLTQAGPVSFSTNYRSGSETAHQVSVTPTGNYDGISYSVGIQTGKTWLTVAGGPTYTANMASAGSSQLNFNLVPGNADGLNGMQSATITLTPAGGGSPTTFDVHLTVDPANSLTVAASYSFTNPYRVSTETVQTVNVTPTGNYDGITYTVGIQSGKTWVTVGAGPNYTANTSGTGGSAQLTFTLVPAYADGLTGSQTAQITLTPAGGGSPVNFDIDLVVNPANSMTVNASYSFTNPYRSGSETGQTLTVTPTANYDGVVYTVGIESGKTWVTVGGGPNYTANIASGTSSQLTFTLAPAQADGLTGQQTALITLTAAGVQTTFNIQVTVNPANALTVSDSSFASSYVPGTETVQTLNVTPTANYDGVTYTASVQAGKTWLTLTAGTYTANVVSGTSTQLAFTLVPANADAFTSQQSATITLTPAGGGAVVTFKVLLNIGASTLTSTPNTLTLFFPIGGSGVIGTNTANLTASAAGVNYTMQKTASATWLTVTGGTGVAGTTPTVLTYAVNVSDTTFAAFTAGTQHQATVSFYIQGVAAPAATMIITVNVVTPSTLTASPAALTFANYTKGGTAPTAQKSTLSDTNATDTDSVLAFSVPPWLNCTVGGTVTSSVSDTLNCTVVTGSAGADGLNAGLQTANVHVQVAGQADTIVSVSLTINAATSPLTISPTPVVLTYLIGGGSSQIRASQVANITSVDPLSDAFTIAAPTGLSVPNWLNLSKTSGSAKTGGGNGDSVTISLVNANVPVTAASSTSFTLLFHIDAYNPDRALVVTMNVVAQPMTANPAAVSLTYSKAGSGTAGAPVGVSISVLPGNNNLAYTLDTSTVPVWLTVGLPTPANTSNATQVNFSVTPNVSNGLSTGNYTANVGLKPTSATYAAELIIPVAFTISNAAPGLTFKEGAGPFAVPWAPGMQIPAPPITPQSSNEPIPFTAACTVTPSDPLYAGSTPCTLNPNNGVAYTWGDQMIATLDPVLFNGSTLGNTVQVSVKVTPTGSGSAVTLVYNYTLTPVTPKVTSSIPTQAAHIPVNTNLVVTLQGSGFVGPGSIKPGTIVPTQVYLGASTTPLAQSSYVVLSPSVMMVTIPETAFPTLVNGKPSPLQIGLANQTNALQQPTTYQIQWPLTITTAPVIYAVTSTASYVQPNPMAAPPGNLPNAAPFDLVSIFGDNFGPTGANYVTAPENAFGQISTNLNLTPSASKASNLTVTFKSTAAHATAISAPILFASENQINAIVPSGVAMGTNTVTVTSGATTNVSDGLFQVNGVAADPGIFTLASDGTGQGAILNLNLQTGAAPVNNNGNPAPRGSWISIYMTGLGVPDSTAIDSGTLTTGYPQNCVTISNTTKGTPGYLQVVNASTKTYTAPSPAWSTIDGAVIDFNPKLVTLIVPGALPPCFIDAVTVSFGQVGNQVTSTTTNNTVTYAGFVDGAVAGLYQINVQVPPGAPVGMNVPVTVTLGSNTSPAVTMAIN